MGKAKAERGGVSRSSFGSGSTTAIPYVGQGDYATMSGIARAEEKQIGQRCRGQHKWKVISYSGLTARAVEKCSRCGSMRCTSSDGKELEMSEPRYVAPPRLSRKKKGKKKSHHATSYPAERPCLLIPPEREEFDKMQKQEVVTGNSGSGGSFPADPDISHVDLRRIYPDVGSQQPKAKPLVMDEADRQRLDRGWADYFEAYSAFRACGATFHEAEAKLEGMQSGRSPLASSMNDRARQSAVAEKLSRQHVQQRGALEESWNEFKVLLEIAGPLAAKHFAERNRAINRRIGACRIEARRIWRNELDPLGIVVQQHLASLVQKQHHSKLQRQVEGLEQEEEKLQTESKLIEAAQTCCAEFAAGQLRDCFFSHWRMAGLF